MIQEVTFNQYFSIGGGFKFTISFIVSSIDTTSREDSHTAKTDILILLQHQHFNVTNPPGLLTEQQSQPGLSVRLLARLSSGHHKCHYDGFSRPSYTSQSESNEKNTTSDQVLYNPVSSREAVCSGTFKKVYRDFRV